MANAKIWVFDVDHGFMAFVRAPSSATLAIDCGKGDEFSPTTYIRQWELMPSERDAQYPLSELVVTHPHDDHIQDIARLAEYLKPRVLWRQRYDWEELEAQSEGQYANLHQWVEFQEDYIPPADEPDWGAMKLSHWYLTLDEAKELNESSFINNSSIISIVEMGSFKMTFPGDIEKDGWLKLLERQEFCAALRGTTIFVTSHHGHSSGYVPEIYDVMGKPAFNLSSIHRGDENIENAYSTPQTARGVTFDGEPRYSLTTRRHGSCLIKAGEDGRGTFWFARLEPNLPKPTSYGRPW